MPYDLTEPLVIGISSRALFDLEEENRIFEEQGLDAYTAYQKRYRRNPQQHRIGGTGQLFDILSLLQQILCLDYDRAHSVLCFFSYLVLVKGYF